MAQEEGVRVTGKAVTDDENSTYATHEDKLSHGGLKVFTSEAEMLLKVTYDRRKGKLGMPVVIPDGNGGYKWLEFINEPGEGNLTTISDWQEIEFGGNVPGDTTLVGNWTPTGTTLATQYPDTTGVTNGVWAIDGLGSGVEFDFTVGDLSGESGQDGNGMLYSSVDGFSLINDYQMANLEPYLMKDGSKQIGGGHEIQENSVATTQEDALNIITNGLEVVVFNISGVSTDIELKFKANTDVDMTGVQDTDVVHYNSITGKFEPIASKVFDDILHSVEANISADGQLSTIVPNKYICSSVVITEDSGNNAGNISIGNIASGGQVVSGQPVLADDDIKAQLVDANGVYFSTVNDTDLFISSDDWNGASVTIYFTFIRV